MTHYRINFEVDPDGACAAYVIDLFGCIVWAADQAEALRVLPEAIRAYGDWYARNGERELLPEEPITLEVAEVSATPVPRLHGSRAALFASDREPLERGDLGMWLYRVDYRRDELMRLVSHLPVPIMKWQAGPDAPTIRAILRHIGNTEEFYVSRLVDPATLPRQWAHDEKRQTLAFLRMERRTVWQRLRKLTDEELEAVVTPRHPSGHADELWSARKVLRRMLEHEYEHVLHIYEVLDAWQAQLLARVAAERAALLFGLLGLDEPALTTVPVADGLTIKDLLAHIAAWDELYADRIAQVVAGQADTLVSVELDEWNAALAAARRDWSLAQALDAFMGERARYLAALDRVPTPLFHEWLYLPWGVADIRTWTAWRASHDRGHAWEIERWRRRAKPARAITPRPLLMAAFAAARAELLATAALVPPADRATRPLCNGWTLKDKLGHLADWDRVAADAFRDLAAGRDPAIDPTVDPETDFDRWNAAHRAARQDQPWEAVWQDFTAARAALAAALAALDDAAFQRPFASPWNPTDSAQGWVRIWLHHDREHAAEIRTGLDLPLPARLKHV